MTIQDIIQSFVLPVLTSGGVIWLSREWISARLKTSIQHEYDQKLETHKARLKSQNDASLFELKQGIDQRFTLYKAAQTSFAEVQKATIERKLDAIEKLWKEKLTFDKSLPSTLKFIDLLVLSEYRDAPNHERFKEYARDGSEEKIAKLLCDSDDPIAMVSGITRLEEVRPYVGEYLWSVFYSYRLVMGRISLLLHWSLKEPDKIEWYKDKAIQQVLEAVLTSSQLDEFEKINFGKISWLQQRLESKILDALQKIISGEELGAKSLAQAELIQRRVATMIQSNRMNP